MSEARNDPNVEQLSRDYNGLYMDELKLAFIGTILHNQKTTLRNQELAFKNLRALVRSIHIMELMMSKRNKCQEGTSVPVPSTQMRLPL
ncbi:hypothetical protein Scep_016942 [Stephania cephalantha]|uniref:Uncharacterized protein n=1 Tax=Stephania cephalantha TaxID=152367 RepID=A0AAP0INN0_9MAGN